MKKILIVANWKCNPSTRKQAEHLFGTVIIHNKILDKDFGSVMIQIVNPTALLRLRSNDGSFFIS